jgi:hypothetical protein
VWEVLADFPAYPGWNPFIRSVEGEATPSGRLRVRIQPPGGREMSFKPTVLAAEPGRELRWLGRFLLPGVLDGEHSFRIEPIGGGRVRFVQAERFSGVLVRFLGRTLERTQRGFEEMNEALKGRAER